jgi:hypothetical protein
MAEARDPLDTPQQRDIELSAVRLLQKPEAIAAGKEVAAYWIDRVKPSAAQRALFDFEYEQVKLCAAMDALNQDAIHPRIHAFGRFAHMLDGVHIPGTKSGNPNPDYIYRFITIDDTSRYIIRGETVGRAPAVAEFAVLTKEQSYLANLSARHVAFDADGRFTLTVDPDAPEMKNESARVNHLQTKAGASQVLIRDMLTDITVERPYRLSVERLGPAPRAPLTDADALACFGARLRKFVDDMLFIAERMIYSKPVNTFPAPTVHQGGIYAVSQAYAAGHYKIKADEALVFTLTLGGAAYAVVPVNNVWGGLGDYMNHRATLGTVRAAPNPDGSYTFVIAVRDPGVANWVDPGGMEEGVIFVRWAGLDPQYQGPPPTLQTQLVPLAEIARVLPPGVPRADAAERKRQMAAHAAAYAHW